MKRVLQSRPFTKPVRDTRHSSSIALEAEQETEILQHAERDYPFECCGLLLGRLAKDESKTVVETYPISNSREEGKKRNRFLIRPAKLLEGEHYARNRSLDVVGFYHSHPDDYARPSQYDLDHAWPTYSYIIVSVREGFADEMRSWQLQGDRSRFVEEQLLKGL